MNDWLDRLTKSSAARGGTTQQQSSLVPGKQTHVDNAVLPWLPGAKSGGSVFAPASQPRQGPLQGPASNHDPAVVAADMVSLRALLASARVQCDAALDVPSTGSPADYARIIAAAKYAIESAELAQDIALRSGVESDVAADVDKATRSLGRMYAYIESLDPITLARYQLNGTQWRQRMQGAVRSLRGRAGLAGEWIGDVVGGKAIAADRERPDTAKAREAIGEWQKKAALAIEALREWQTANMIEYHSMVSQNPALSWDADTLHQTMSNLVGNVLGEVPEAVAKRVLKQAGKVAVVTALPTGIGFVIALVIETVSSILYDLFFHDKWEHDKTHSDIAKEVGNRIQQAHALTSKAARSEINSLSDDVNATNEELDNASTQARVDEIEAAVRKDSQQVKAYNSGDRSIAKAMLADWVREHADDEESANKETSPHQWKEAAKMAFGQPNLNNHPELFAYQSRATWHEAGLPPDQIHKGFDMMIEASERTQYLSPVKDAYHGKTFIFGGVDPVKLGTYMNKHAGLEKAKEFMRSVGNLGNGQQHTIECTLDLVTVDGTTYVNRWVYVVYTEHGEYRFAVSPTESTAPQKKMHPW